MGGKLFDLPRMPRAEYVEREAAIRAHLEREIPGRFRIPRYYGDKPDFGDMDVICAADPGWEERRRQIAGGLGITEARAVGHVYSTVFRGLQTDFFSVEPEHLDSTCDFMSFNDLGNLLGRIFRRYDLKYGEHGLSYVFRRSSDSHYKAELTITRDFKRICAFLGLDPAPWHAGFGSLPEMFSWVISSPSFSVAPYLDPAPRGDAMARRAAQRPTIARFVRWLEENRVDQRPTFADRTTYLPLVAEAFPEAELERRLEEEREKEARAVEIASRFNGRRVMALRPELEGPALGAFIVAFKRSFPDFEAWILSTPQEGIDEAIRSFTTI